MGSRHITTKYRTRVLRTDREGLIRFLEKTRGLESALRASFIESRADTYRESMSKYSGQLTSEYQALRDSAAASLERLEGEIQRTIESTTDATQMRAVFHLDSSSKERYSGTPREIVEHNNFSKAKSVFIQPSGEFVGPLSIIITSSDGVEVELSTSDNDLYETSSVSIPAWLKEVSGPAQFAYRPGVQAFLWALLIATNFSAILDRESRAVLIMSWVSIGLLAVYCIFRYVLCPQIQIREEPRSSKRILKWIGYGITTIILGMIGTYFYDQIK